MTDMLNVSHHHSSLIIGLARVPLYHEMNYKTFCRHFADILVLNVTLHYIYFMMVIVLYEKVSNNKEM